MADVFTQKSPSDGKPPGDRTFVRILYDDNYVYVGFDCPQTAEVVARLTRRDRQVETDAVAVAFDTRGDGKSAFEFQVSAAGVISDGLHFNDTDFNQDWDENWEAKVATRKDGWSAEMRIPLRALRYPAKPVQSWGLQLKRYVSARQELDEWSHIPRESAVDVSGYGRLDGLVGLKAKTAIEITPYVSGGIHHHDPYGTVLVRGFEPTGSAGFDLRWHVSQALTLNVSVLPDFGQVEADQIILNLTTYELYYPEKRPFFLEGFDTFSTPMQLLYTRRIGRAPPAPVLNGYTPYGEQLVESPDPVDHLHGGEARRRPRRPLVDGRARRRHRPQHRHGRGAERRAGGAARRPVHDLQGLPPQARALRRRVRRRDVHRDQPAGGRLRLPAHPRPRVQRERHADADDHPRRRVPRQGPGALPARGQPAHADAAHAGIALLPRLVRRGGRRALAIALGRLQRDRAGDRLADLERPAAPPARRHHDQERRRGPRRQRARREGRRQARRGQRQLRGLRQGRRLQRPRLHAAAEPAEGGRADRLPPPRTLRADARDALRPRGLRPGGSPVAGAAARLRASSTSPSSRTSGACSPTCTSGPRTSTTARSATAPRSSEGASSASRSGSAPTRASASTRSSGRRRTSSPTPSRTRATARSRSRSSRSGTWTCSPTGSTRTASRASSGSRGSTTSSAASARRASA